MKRSNWITIAVVAAVIALFFYMSTARANPGMQGLRGVSGAVQLRYRAGATVAEGHPNGAQHGVWTGGEGHERDDRVR